MASQKQIDANRKNSLKSTGPRSADGRAKSRLNAIRDGLTGQITTLSDADRVIFEQLKTELIAGLNPQTPMEHKLAHAIAWDTWRLDHLRAIEMNVYALGLEQDEADTALADARTFRAEAKRFELMSLYEQRMNRSLHRNLAILRDLQAERKRNYEHDKKEEMLIARLHEFNDMPYKASTRPSPNGFIFSDEDIAIGALRQRYIDTANCMVKKTNPNQLYGSLRTGQGDSLLRPLSEDEKAIKTVPLETLAIRRQNHPEEFFRTPPQ